MNSSDGDQEDRSRRAFLLSGGGLLTTLWVGTHWSAIAAAAHHADQAGALPEAAGFEFFDPAEAADVEAICAQIVPSGATPGAREAHAVYFIDRAMATFFASQAADFRAGLGDFRAKFRAANPASAGFSGESAQRQIEFLTTVDHSPFFEGVRNMTLLGMFSSPKYGGNFQGSGWRMMGFADQHAFAPPFGYYDRDYAGFVPYGSEKRAGGSRS